MVTVKIYPAIGDYYWVSFWVDYDEEEIIDDWIEDNLKNVDYWELEAESDY